MRKCIDVLKRMNGSVVSHIGNLGYAGAVRSFEHENAAGDKNRRQLRQCSRRVIKMFKHLEQSDGVKFSVAKIVE